MCFFPFNTRIGAAIRLTVSASMPEASDVIILILNTMSQVMIEGRQIKSFDVSDFPSGLYFVRDRRGMSAQLVVE